MRIVFFLLMAFLLGGCAPKQEPSPPASEESAVSEEPAAEGDADSEESDDEPAPVIETAAEDEPLPDETSPITYENQVAFGGSVFFHVKTYGQGNRKLLVLQALRDGKIVDEPLKVSIDGDVVSAIATDLDGDENGEVLVFARSRMPGQPGVFSGFAFVGERFSPIQFPDLDGRQAKGYRGSDVFRVEGAHVIRTFPVFEGAGNQPTAQTRTITYGLDGFALTVQGTEG
jgi:hypothetical protein